MLDFNNLELIAEIAIDRKKVSIYRCQEGRYFIHNVYSIVDTHYWEIHPAKAVAIYNKASNLLDWALHSPAKYHD